MASTLTAVRSAVRTAKRKAPTAARSLVRRARRARGDFQLRRLTTGGVAPTAVLAALRAAAHGSPSPQEKVWIDRIEAKRTELLASDASLEFPDFGSGKDVVEGQPPPVVHRTLGVMTQASKPPRWAYLLFRVVRELRPSALVELGACVGISGSYQSAALALNATPAKLVSLEGAPVLADRSNQTLAELGLAEWGEVRLGQFTDTLQPTLDELGAVQYAFIDGHHDEVATLEYMEQILKSAGPETVLAFDDINWSPGMRRAWDAIVADSRFRLTVEMRAVGLAVVSADSSPSQSWVISYS